MSISIQTQFTGSTSLKVTPFHERTSVLNQAQGWRRWSGYLSATAYDLTHDFEYYSIRTKAALLDITPLHKYIIEGPQAELFLNRLVTRNVHLCKIHQVIYTPWCDEYGKQIDDGTIQRLKENRFRITSAEPNMEWLSHNSTGLDVNISDDSEITASLALQGPNSRAILNQLTDKNIDQLKFFWLTNRWVNDIPVTISRTGYTGDLGYELWTPSKFALELWDSIIEAGVPFGITPTGLHALDLVRIEAALILLDVDYISASHAIIDQRKSSPYELGLGWAVKLNKEDFIGKRALDEEYRKGPEWLFRGIEIEWEPLEEIYRDVGLPPQLPGMAWRTSTPLYSGNEQVGYATSGCWSPLLKKYIALAHLKSDYAREGTPIKFEVKVEHFRKTTPAIVVQTPFYDPERKRSCP